MPTYTLKDQTPSTTIAFDSFSEINERYDAKYFKALAIPDNGPTVIIILQAWVHRIKMTFQLVDDDTYPSSGDSAADKWANLVSLLKSGGDSAGFFTLTFDSEDSTEATPQLESYNGSVKNLEKLSIAGTHTVKIDGSFEFYEGIVS